MGKDVIPLNSKGFNLFTALVAFVLIALSVLLVNSMVQSERSASTRITQEQSMAELQAVADMARSDAIQVFNYGLRKAIEDWMTDPNTGGITLDLSEKSWPQIKKSFAEAKFGGSEGREFARFTASTLTALFYSEAHFGNYAVSLEGSETLETLLAELTSKSVEEDDFFEIIECETGDPKQCPKGTFYVNLKVAKLSQGDYERLPRIKVLNKSTGDEIKEIILPRANFRIYVPLRVFKAIAEARALAHFPLNNGNIDHVNDEGLFSARTHNMIEEMAIGFCDKGYCSPRGTLFTHPTSKSYAGGACVGDTLHGRALQVNLSSPWFAGTYNAGDADSGAGDSMERVMQATVEKVVCEIATKAVREKWLDSDPTDTFKLIGSLSCPPLKELEVTAESMPSKNLLQEAGSAPQGSPGGGSSYAHTNPARSPATKIGLYSLGGALQAPNINYTTLACRGSKPLDGQPKCTEINKISVKLWFKETDPKYMVDKSNLENKIYSIRLLDNSFTPFTANWGQGAMSSNIYLQEPRPENCLFSRGWTCSTIIDGPDPVGCAPWTP